MPRRILQIVLAFLLLACGTLLSVTINHGTAQQDTSLTQLAPLERPVFSIVASSGRLVLRGTTASAAHEAGLLQLAADHYDIAAPQTDFKPGVVLAENWESTSTRLVYVLAAMESATAIMQQKSISIRGITANPVTFAARLEFLRENVHPELPVESDVLVIELTTTEASLCQRAFSNLFLAPVAFEKSSTKIRTSSFSTLDRITEFARDCRSKSIAITGHSDSTGDESWNRRLSVARAQAVADHISQKGIDPQRLIVAGLGSSTPIADNDTTQGRSINRRIEFELN